MSVYHIDASQRIEIGRTEVYNATTSDLAFGLAPTQDLLTQTVLAYVYSVGGGEGGFAYMCAKTPSASANGPRFFIDTGTGALTFASTSTTAAAPLRTTNTGALPSSNIWTHIAATWDGTVTATGIQIYFAVTPNTPLAEAPSYSATTNGTGTPSSGSGNNFHIGNREGTDRTFNGTIAYVARWNRVLSLDALRYAQLNGPLSVPDGLMLCWAGGRDCSPSRLVPSTKTAVPLTGQGPIKNLLGRTTKRLFFNITSAAPSTFNALLLAGD